MTAAFLRGYGLFGEKGIFTPLPGLCEKMPVYLKIAISWNEYVLVS